METNAIGPTTRPTGPNIAEPETRKSIIASDFETFLKMLTAQAKYQDPLEPLDSTEYASQLAQFSSVEQSVLTNDLLTAMSAQLGAANMAQFASWIGMDARTTEATHFNGTPITVTQAPMSGAEALEMVVRDSSGTEIQRLPIPLGEGPIQWAGVRENGNSFPPGLYSFETVSKSNGDEIGSRPGAVYSRITEARTDAGGKTLLILEGGAEVSADDVSALRENRG